MSSFQNTLQTEVEDIISLPLLHTCDAFGFRNMLQDLKLIPQECDVFNSKLLYTYYGVPSYRINFNNATVNTAYYPVCLILDSTKINQFHKMYPFDSGAFIKKSEIKEQFFHSKTNIVDFELDADISSAKKVIKTFYETNENYIDENPISKSFNAMDFEALGYQNLISNQQSSKVDNRASSIEIIFNEDIVLDKNILKQLIVPNCFKDDVKAKTLMNDNFGIDNPIGYETFRGMPSEYFGLIRSKYIQYLKG